MCGRLLYYLNLYKYKKIAIVFVLGFVSFKKKNKYNRKDEEGSLWISSSDWLLFYRWQ